MSTQPKHAEFSASGSSQWLNCPGSIGMKSLVPKQASSPAARDGTAAHQLLELCLKQKKDAIEFIDRKIVVDDDNVKTDHYVDDNMADAVQVCLDFVRKLIKKHKGCEVKIEQKVDLSKLIAPDTFGTVDVRILVPFEKLIIIDYKHGAGVPVEAEDNTQMLYYGLGSAAEEEFDIESVDMHIVQPRCPHADGPIRSMTIETEELRMWGVVFRKGVKNATTAKQAILKAQKPIEKYLKAGSWCTFCPAKAICPAMHTKTIEDAVLDFDEVDDEEVLVPQIKPSDLTIKQMTTIMASSSLIKGYIDSVFIHAQNLMETGTEIPGWKLVKKKSNAKFKMDEKRVLEELIDVGFTKGELTRVQLKTITDLKKICGKKTIASMTDRPDTGNTIAPDKDSRKSVVPSIESDFDEVDEDDFD